MRRHELPDEQWARIEPLLPGRPGTAGARAQDNRRFVNAVLWMAKAGAQRRDLPERFGKPNTVLVRFCRWAKTGQWQRIFEALQEPDLEWMMIDSASIRAHLSASGQKGGPLPTRSDAHEVV